MLQRSCVLIVAALSVLSFSGCANLGENQQTGTIAGGLVGGLLGSQAKAVAEQPLLWVALCWGA